MKRELYAVMLIFAWPLFCFAQASSYLGLTPGINTRDDAERALGKPAREISPTLLEYAGREKILKIYIQYRPNSGPMERIEILLSAPQIAEQIFYESGLPLAAPAASKVNQKGKLEEYYPANFIVLTYKSADKNSGVDRIGYYSKAFYEAASKKTGNQIPTGKTEKTDPVTPPSTPGNYDQMTIDAWNAMLAKDFTKALNLLQEAIRIAPQKGTAYSYLGIAYLYGFGDIASAEKSMLEALARNDRATFRVLHDHSGTFQYFCYGWLHIGKAEVQFESDERHGFQLNDSEIKETKLNNLVGAAYYAFHIKSEKTNYNLAPGSLKLPETNLILALIAK